MEPTICGDQVPPLCGTHRIKAKFSKKNQVPRPFPTPRSLHKSAYATQNTPSVTRMSSTAGENNNYTKVLTGTNQTTHIPHTQEAAAGPSSAGPSSSSAPPAISLAAPLSTVIQQSKPLSRDAVAFVPSFVRASATLKYWEFAPGTKFDDSIISDDGWVFDPPRRQPMDMHTRSPSIASLSESGSESSDEASLNSIGTPILAEAAVANPGIFEDTSSTTNEETGSVCPEEGIEMDEKISEAMIRYIERICAKFDHVEQHQQSSAADNAEMVPTHVGLFGYGNDTWAYRPKGTTIPHPWSAGLGESAVLPRGGPTEVGA